MDSSLLQTSSSLLSAYRGMLRIRRFEARCLELSVAGDVAGSIHLCGGQEAIPVGARMALSGDDRIVATYRGHGWAIASGIPIDALLAEVCHRASGINGGRAGSPYLLSPAHGFIGENSIVGAGVPIGAGVALAAKIAGTGRVAVVSIGDGAMNQGATHEGLAFAAAMRLPMILMCENNDWSEMTPISAMALVTDLADRAEGYGIPGVVVDGCDPFAVADAVRVAAERAREGDGPTLLECKTVRLMGHYNADIQHYRSKTEMAEDALRDPIDRLRTTILEADPASEASLLATEAVVSDEIDRITELALAAPTPDVATARHHVYAVGSPAAVPRTAESVQDLTYVEAVNEALRIELHERPDVILYGEDIAVPGGVFGVTRKLQATFGATRVFDTPISESAILGSALGAAREGLRPVVEIMWADFLLVALDQLVNQAANTRYVSGGAASAPMVVRTQQGATPGSCAQHSQSLEALLAHIPGLRVGLPATPQDAYSMLRAAIADDDPCVLIEARGLYRQREPVRLGGAIDPIGGARLRRSGSDAAIITWGSVAPRAFKAAEELADEGLGVAVLDLRWLSPLDDRAISDVVTMAGGRVAVVHEANLTGGFGGEIAARVTEAHFNALRAPVARIGTPDVRMPASPVLQEALLPSVASIASRMRDLISSSVAGVDNG
jgi:2-oxoisovalerate dehydrogenase E1 component